jgi:hypothetical protein
MSDTILRSFALDADHLQIVMLKQQELILSDIKYTLSDEAVAKKKEWLREWQATLTQKLASDVHSDDWFTQPDDYAERITDIQQPENHLQAGIMLLELITFAPYMPLSQKNNPLHNVRDGIQEGLGKTRDAFRKGFSWKGVQQRINSQMSDFEQSVREMPDKIKTSTEQTVKDVQTAISDFTPPTVDDIKNQFKNGLQRNSEVWTANLMEIAVELGFERQDVVRLQRSVELTHDSLTNKWRNLGFFVVGGMLVGAVTLGAAAPTIAGVVGSTVLGLKGAAAVTGGLALIGGVIGGGMSAGPVVIVGGGLLLGLGTGSAANQAYQYATASQISAEAVKLEVILKEIILNQQDTAVVIEILDCQRKTIQSYQLEIDRLRLDTEDNQNQIDELEKSVEILEKALKRNQDLVRGS